MKFVFLLAILTITVGSAYASGYGGPDVIVTTDKTIYEPGDEATITVSSPFLVNGSVELVIQDGLASGNDVFYFFESSDNGYATVKFTLPKESSSYQYAIKAAVHNHNEYGETVYFANTVLIFTKDNVDKAVISDLSIDKNQVRPGESVRLKFKITDGIGNTIPSAYAIVGLCESLVEEPIPWVAITPKWAESRPEEPGRGCVMLHRAISTSSDTFDVKIKIFNDVPQGDYKLNIWSYPFPSQVHARKVIDLAVKGEPVNPQEEPVLADIGTYSAGRLLSPGQTVSFHGNELGDISGGLVLPSPGRPAVPLVSHIHIVDPYGKTVYDNTVTADNNGTIQNLPFPITEELKNGQYRIHYDITWDGNFVQNRGAFTDSGIDYFNVIRPQKFSFSYEGKSYDVVFKSVDLIASNAEFDQSSKMLSMDVVKLSVPHSSGCAILEIEEPLLTGPFMAQINDKAAHSCFSQSGIHEASVGPIYENGTLTIIGTHVVPEFGSVSSLILAVSLISVIGVFGAKFRKNL